MNCPSHTTHVPRVLGLTGLAGCGKDTVAGMLKDHRGYQPVAFADPLRMQIMDAFGVDIHLLTCRETKELPTPLLALSRCRDFDFEARMINYNTSPLLDMTAPRSPRWIMQMWGTEYRRKDDPHYWTKAMQRRIHHIVTRGHCAVVTDVRYMNEAHLVREMGGNLWQINRSTHTPAATGHSSETAGVEFFPDELIDNGGDLHQLLQAVLRAVPNQAVVGRAAA